MPVQYQLADLLQKSLLFPAGTLLDYAHEFVTHDWYPLRNTGLGRLQAATLESAARLLRHYPKQEFGLDETGTGDRSLPVHERVVMKKPFCHLLHFECEHPTNKAKLLVVAALSGHHATISRETYEAFLADHDVYVTDWQDARNVPLQAGRFGFEDYVEYLIDFLEVLGPDTHVVGLCQASVPLLTAIAVMAAAKNACRPRSMTLIAGPIDVRVNPNRLTRISQLSNVGLHRLLTVKRVPVGYPGAGRKVYPGILQLFGFISLNVRAHLQKHLQFFLDVCNGEHDAAQKHREFYDEYFAVLDMTEEFFLETLERVFFDQHLPKGKMRFRGELVDCAAITDVPMLTVEGENDDLCEVGMTEAAHALCTNLPASLRRHHVQAGVGHYGVFSGSRYREEVAPRIKDFIACHQKAPGRESLRQRRSL